MSKGYIESLSKTHELSSFLTWKNSTNVDGYLPEYGITYGTTNRFSSHNLEESWWSIEFKRRKIRVNFYRLKTGNFAPGYYGAHPKSWVLYGRKTNGKYIAISTINNCIEMNQASHVNLFHISSKDVFTGFKISDVESFSGAYPNTLTFEEFDVYGFDERCSQKYVKSSCINYFIVICLVNYSK